MSDLSTHARWSSSWPTLDGGEREIRIYVGVDPEGWLYLFDVDIDWEGDRSEVRAGATCFNLLRWQPGSMRERIWSSGYLSAETARSVEAEVVALPPEAVMSHVVRVFQMEEAL